MNERLNRYIGILLILVQTGTLLPAQSIAELGRQAGLGRLERYLEQARSENDERRWEELSAQGLQAALTEWESVYTYEKEQNGLREEAKEDFIKEAKKLSALRYAEWLSDRFFSERTKLEQSEFARRLRESSQNMYAEKNTIEEGEAESVRHLWQREAGKKYIDEYIRRWTAANLLYEHEIRALGQNGWQELLTDEESRTIIEVRYKNFKDYVRKEYEKISEAEENALIGRLLYDKHSLRKLKSEEAAKAIGESLAQQAERESQAALEGLFGQLETQAENVSAADIEPESRRWLESFRVEFEKALKLWDDAERGFIVKRMEWEEKAGERAEKAEEAWIAAYEALREKREQWQKKVNEQLEQGRKKWNGERKALEDVLSTAQSEFEAAAKKEREQKERLIDMQIAKYRINRQLLLEAFEGIQNWHEVWAGEYKGIYAYWKTEGTETSEDEWRIKADSLDKTEAGLQEWKKRAIAQVLQKSKAKTEALNRDIAGLNKDIQSNETSLKAWKEKTIGENDYAGARQKEESIRIIEDKLKALRQALQEKEKLLEDINKALSFEKEDGKKASAEELFAFSGERLEKSIKELIQKGVLEYTVYGTFNAYEDIIRWLKKAQSYKNGLEDAAGSLAEQTGSVFVTADGYEYIDELQREKLKMQSVSRYWKRELAIAEEVDRYATDESSKAQWKEETLANLKNAKEAFESAYNAYETQLENVDLKERAIEEQQKLIADVKRAVQVQKDEVEKARRAYAAALAAMRNVKKETIEQAIADYASQLSAVWEENREKETHNTYYASLWAYTQEAEREKNDTYIHELIHGAKKGNGTEKESLASLRAKRDRAKKASENEGYTDALDESDYYDEKIRAYIQSERAVLQDAQSTDGRKKEAAAVLKELYKSIEYYWDEQAKIREGTVRFILLGKTGLEDKKADENDIKRLRIRAVLQTERTLLELRLYNEDLQEDEKRKDQEHFDLISRLLDVEDANFIAAAEQERQKGGYIRDVMRQTHSGKPELALLIYRNEKYAQGLETERLDSLIRTWDSYRNFAYKNGTHAESLKKLAQKINAQKGESGVRFDTAQDLQRLTEYAYDLKEESVYAYDHIRQAVNEYIEALLEYKAVADGGKPDTAQENTAQKINELQNAIAQNEQLHTQYAQFEQIVYDMDAYIRFLKTKPALLNGNEELKKTCGRYLGAFVLERMDDAEKMQAKQDGYIDAYIAALKKKDGLLFGMDNDLTEEAASYIKEKTDILIEEEKKAVFTEEEERAIESSRKLVKILENCDANEKRYREEAEAVFIEFKTASDIERMVKESALCITYNAHVSADDVKDDIANSVYQAVIRAFKEKDATIDSLVESVLRVYNEYTDVLTVPEAARINLKQYIEKIQKERIEYLQKANEAIRTKIREEHTEAFARYKKAEYPDTKSEWLYAYMVSDETVYKYFLGRKGYEHIEEVLKYVGEGTREKLTELYNVRKAAFLYASRIDGTAEEYAESYKGYGGKALSANEREKLQKLLTGGRYTGEACKALYTFVSDNRKNVQTAITKQTYTLRYFLYMQRETENSRYKWSRTAKDLQVGEADDSSLKQREKDSISAAQAAGTKEKVLERLVKKIETLTSYITDEKHTKGIEIDESDSEETVKALLDESEKEFTPSQRLTKLRFDFERAAEEKSADAIREQGILKRLYTELHTLQALNDSQNTEKIDAKEKAQENYRAACEEYEKKEAEYREKNRRLIALFEAYNSELSRAESVFEQAEKKRFERDKAQAVYEWAQSVYLENMGGENSRIYKTPKERLTEVRYKAVRAQAAVDVLEALHNDTDRTTGSAEYEKAWDEYKKAYEALYVSKVLQFEINAEVQRQEERVRQAERAERRAFDNLIREAAFEKTEKGNELSLQNEHKKLLDMVRLERIQNADGSWSYTPKLNFLVDNDNEKSIINSTEKSDEAILNTYFTEYTEEIKQQDGIIKTSKSLHDAEKWLEGLFQKGGETYLNSLAIAALYVRNICANEDLKFGFDSKSVVPMGECAATLHGVDWGKNFSENVKAVLAESYNKVDKEDLAKYILYRDTALRGFSWDERERNELHIQALERTGRQAKLGAFVQKTVKTAALVAIGISTAVVAAIMMVPGYLFMLPGTIYTINTHLALIFANGIVAADAGRKETDLMERADSIYKLISGKKENAKRYNKSDDYRDWQNTKQTLKAEKEKLERYYGKSADGQAIAKDTFIGSVTEILANAKGKAGVKDFKQYYESRFDRLKDEDKQSNSLALRAIHIEVMNEEKSALNTVEQEAKEARESQEREEKTFYTLFNKQFLISEEEQKTLKELAEKASDINSTAEQRKKAAAEYEKKASSVIGEEKELKAAFKAQIHKAWGSKTWSRKEHGKRYEGLYARRAAGHAGGRTDLNRGEEAYYTEALEVLKQSALAAYKDRLNVKLELQKHEWALSKAQFESRYMQWEEQAGLIEELGKREWEKAAGRINSAYKQWAEDFTAEKGRVDGLWRKNYEDFRACKQVWIDKQYAKASRIAAGEASKALTASGDTLVSAQEAIEEVYSVPEERGLFSIAESEQNGYVESLFSSSYLSLLTEGASSLQERIAEGKAFGGSGIQVKRQHTGSLEKLMAAEQTIQELNEESRLLASRKAVIQAQKRFTRIEQAFYERLEAENRGIREWEEKTVYEQGYKVDNAGIRRTVVIGESLIGGLIRQEQWVHRYEYYESERTDIAEHFYAVNTEGLDEYALQLMIRQAQQDMQQQTEKVFGKTDEKGKKVKEGTFDIHKGTESTLKSGKDFDLQAGKEGNIDKAGSGQIGKILLDIQWNRMEASIGMAEMNKGLHDIKLWDDRYSPFKAPTIRSITEIAVAVAATAIVSVATGGAGGVLLGAAIGAAMNLADDVVFASIDAAGGYKSAEQIGNELGKKALSSVVSAGLGAAGSWVGGLSAVKNLSGFAKAAFDVGKTGVEGVISTTLNTGIQAMDFSKIGTRDFFNEKEFVSRMGSLSTWSGTISSLGGSVVSGGLGMMNLGKVDGFNSMQIGQIRSLNGFAGSMASTAIGYGITGNASFNLLRVNGTGLLEMNLGKDGFNMQLGMGGTDISLGRISSALAGAQHWEKNREIEKAAKRDGLGNAATALRAQYGFGDGMQRMQLESILKGDTRLARGTGTGEAETVTKDGKRTVYLNNYKDTMSRDEQLAMGITLGHEAYRDGLVGSGQQQFMETARAVIGHTELALRMQADQRYSESMGNIIAGSSILQKDIDAYKSGDMMTMLGHAAGNYDWSKDYWKLRDDGSIEFDGRADLYYGDGENERKIYTSKARGLEGSLTEILAGENATEEQKRQIRTLMADKLVHTVNPDNPYASGDWYWQGNGVVGDNALNKWFFSTADVGKANIGRRLDRDATLSLFGDNLSKIIFDASDPNNMKLSKEDAYRLLAENGLNRHGMFDLSRIPYSLGEIAKATQIKTVANANAEKEDRQFKNAQTYCNLKVGDDYLSYYGDSSKFSNIFIKNSTLANDMGENFSHLGYPRFIGNEQYSAGLLAQIEANRGKLLTASWINSKVAINGIPQSGHVATIVSYYGIYDPRLGPRISQAGLTNGEMWLREGFGYTRFPEINFYHMLSNTEYDRFKNNPTWIP